MEKFSQTFPEVIKPEREKDFSKEESIEQLEERIGFERRKVVKEVLDHIGENGFLTEREKEEYKERGINNSRLLDWWLEEDELKEYLRIRNDYLDLEQDISFTEFLMKRSLQVRCEDENLFRDRFFGLVASGIRPDNMRISGVLEKKMEVFGMTREREFLVPIKDKDIFLDSYSRDFRRTNSNMAMDLIRKKMGGGNNKKKKK